MRTHAAALALVLAAVAGAVPAEPAAQCNDQPVGPDPWGNCRAPDRSRAPPGSPIDPHIPSLRHSTLKTGTRAIVTWSTEEPTRGELTWTLPGEPHRTAREPTPREDHAFVLLHLPPGSQLTYTARHTVPEPTGDGATVESDPHAFTLRNPAPDRQPGRGYHTLNLTVVANQNPVDRAVLERGLDHFADLLWDATDGRVAVANLTLLYDAPHRSEAVALCGTTPRSPACNHVVDAVFTYGVTPIYRGAAWRGGIAEPHEAIYMNNVWEAVVQGTPKEIGSVLAHEVGHYALWMDEAYGSASCYDPETDVSVMGNDRRTTEFDGPTAPCPVEKRGAWSWTTLRNRYAAVGPRSDGPDPGPQGAGPSYNLTVLDFTAPGGHARRGRGPVVVDAGGEARCHVAYCAAVSGTGNATGGLAGASGTGDAAGGVAASGLGDASGGAAVAGLGDASGGQAVSPVGDAEGNALGLSVTGDAAGCPALSVTGDAAGDCVSATAAGNASGDYAVSGTGDARSCYTPDGILWANCIAASGTGDATADFLAVSATGNATSEGYEVSGCEAGRAFSVGAACRDGPSGPRLP